MGLGAQSPRVLAVLAIANGLVAQWLLFREQLGLNVALIAAAMLAAGFAVARRAPARIDRWIPVAALAFAAFPALRDEPPLLAFDIPALAALLLAAAIALSGRRVSDLAPVATLRLGANGLVAALVRGADVFGTVRPRVGPLAPALPVLRGAALAAPLLVTFALLFGSADAVFARVAGDFFDLRRWLDALRDAPGRGALALVFAWLAAGGLWIAAHALPEPTGARIGAVARRRSTEALVVVGSLDVLFAFFIALQIAYLFGGRDTMDLTGLTYSAYARRGFFELIAVAVLVGVIVLAIEWLRLRSRLLVAAELLLVGLTYAVLVSAAYRLALYQSAYGWSELRVYAFALIGWLALCLAAAIVALALGGGTRLPHAVVLSGLLVAAVANLIGPAELSARANVDRFLHPELVPPDGYRGLDTGYLLTLGDAAIPDLVRAFPLLDAAAKTQLGCAIGPRSTLSASLASWSYERERAREALATIDLPRCSAPRP